MVFESTPRYWKPPGKVVFVLGKQSRSLVPIEGMVFESTPRCESQTRVRRALVSLAWRTAVDIFPKMEEFLMNRSSPGTSKSKVSLSLDKASDGFVIGLDWDGRFWIGKREQRLVAISR